MGNWFDAAELARTYAAHARADKAAASDEVLRLVAEIRAKTLEDFARVLLANGNDDTTDPRAVIIAASEAKGERP